MRVVGDDDDRMDLLVGQEKFVIIEVDANAIVGRGGSDEGDIRDNSHIENGLTFCAFGTNLSDDDGMTVGDFVQCCMGNRFVSWARCARILWILRTVGRGFAEERARFEELDEPIHAFIG